MKSFRRGDIVLIDVPIVDGSRVQGGNRPWLIVQNDVGNRHSPTHDCSPSYLQVKENGNAYPRDCHGKGH